MRYFDPDLEFLRTLQRGGYPANPSELAVLQSVAEMTAQNLGCSIEIRVASDSTSSTALAISDEFLREKIEELEEHVDQRAEAFMQGPPEELRKKIRRAVEDQGPLSPAQVDGLTNLIEQSVQMAVGALRAENYEHEYGCHGPGGGPCTCGVVDEDAADEDDEDEDEGRARLALEVRDLHQNILDAARKEKETPRIAAAVLKRADGSRVVAFFAAEYGDEEGVNLTEEFISSVRQFELLESGEEIELQMLRAPLLHGC